MSSYVAVVEKGKELLLDQLGKCPHCKTEWGYTANEPPQEFSRMIAITYRGCGDCVNEYRCPDCGHQWARAGVMQPRRS